MKRFLRSSLLPGLRSRLLHPLRLSLTPASRFFSTLHDPTPPTDSLAEVQKLLQKNKSQEHTPLVIDPIEESKEISDLMRAFLSEETPRPVDINEAGMGGRIQGSVLSVRSGLAYVQYMEDVSYGSMVEFESGIQGVVLKLEKDSVIVGILGPDGSVLPGQSARQISHQPLFPTGPSVVGRVLNGAGQFIDQQAPPAENLHYGVSWGADAPSLSSCDFDVHSQTPIRSGIKAIDFFHPIARGQRVLFTGEKRTGKSTAALDLILQQKFHNDQVNDEEKLYCVYVAIGQTKKEVEKSVAILHQNGALEYTTVIATLDRDPKFSQYMAAYGGCAVAEWFRNNGRHALIVYDHLSAHLVAYEEMFKTLLGVKPELNYMHTDLIERSVILSNQLGGGSLTSIFLAEPGPLSDALSSSVDSTIPFDIALADKGRFPAINCQTTSHRPLPRFFTGASRQLATLYRKFLNASREEAGQAEFSASLKVQVEDEVRSTLDYQEKLTALLSQTEPMLFEEQFVSMYVSLRQNFENFARPADVLQYHAQFLEYVREHRPQLLAIVERMDTEEWLYDELLDAMDAVIAEFELKYWKK